MKKAQGGALLIGVMVSLIIAVIVLGIIAGTLDAQSDTTAVSDDQFTLTNNTCVDITDNCILSLTNIQNGTLPTTLGADNYSLCTAGASSGRYDGIVFTPGDVVTGNNWDGQTVNATYTGVACNYIESGTIRTFLGYIPLLLAVVLLAFVALMIKK